MKKPSVKAQQSLVDAWKCVPKGTRVVVRKDDGQEYLTVVDAPALMLGGHTAVIWLDGISGCFALERVRKATEGDGVLPRLATV